MPTSPQPTLPLGSLHCLCISGPADCLCQIQSHMWMLCLSLRQSEVGLCEREGRRGEGRGEGEDEERRWDSESGEGESGGWVSGEGESGGWVSGGGEGGRVSREGERGGKGQKGRKEHYKQVGCKQEMVGTHTNTHTHVPPLTCSIHFHTSFVCIHVHCPILCFTVFLSFSLASMKHIHVHTCTHVHVCICTCTCIHPAQESSESISQLPECLHLPCLAWTGFYPEIVLKGGRWVSSSAQCGNLVAWNSEFCSMYTASQHSSRTFLSQTFEGGGQQSRRGRFPLSRKSPAELYQVLAVIYQEYRRCISGTCRSAPWHSEVGLCTWRDLYHLYSHTTNHAYTCTCICTCRNQLLWEQHARYMHNMHVVLSHGFYEGIITATVNYIYMQLLNLYNLMSACVCMFF